MNMAESLSKEDPISRLSENKVGYKRAGLFGGTFDPIHLGHLRVAREVKTHFNLDHIIFIPSAHPPHKIARIPVEAHHRIEMTRLAVADSTDFSVSDIELKRAGFSYTIDTIAYFKGISSADSQLYFILGLDAFLEIDTWKSYKALFSQVSFIIMNRPGFGKNESDRENWEMVETFLKTKVAEDYRYSPNEFAFFRSEQPLIHFFHVTPIDISSTRIRDDIRDGRSIGHLVTQNVEQYIMTQGLYR